MTSPAQKKAIRNHRERLARRGLGRFEVQGRTADKELLRTIARKLAEGGVEGARVREAVAEAVANTENPKGGVWAALRRSPLVGADLNIERLREKPREIDL